ncbi:hypothetical protein [Trichlorobacter ammonificans]|uniref:Lipoprotein n=1 Tax=Trichlorobacter ammonificans TaxID=2916410 RepID=A0ABN8HL13_9BACT|nr:hypothetical protein [Trichlorobacter ammonificans]CAH2032324.1 protein of unknown function [Trichlorobacter ammonificans]
MNKTIVVFITSFLFGCANGNYHASPPKTYIDQSKVAVLEFLARPASVSSPGHTYIKLLAEDEDRKMSTVSTYGFYPAANSKLIQIFHTKGELRSELELSNPPSITVTTILNTKQFEDVMLAINDWETKAFLGFKKYQLTTQNCISFVNEIALKTELITPSMTLEFPTQYIEKLAQLNKIPKAVGSSMKE